MRTTTEAGAKGVMVPKTHKVVLQRTNASRIAEAQYVPKFRYTWIAAKADIKQ